MVGTKKGRNMHAGGDDVRQKRGMVCKKAEGICDGMLFRRRGGGRAKKGCSN
jgi:hypothetical protein